LARIHHGRRDLLGRRSVGRLDERGVLATHHHRAGGIDGEHLGTALDERQQDLEVAVHLLPHGREVTAFPGRHAAAVEARRTADVDLVRLEHRHRVPPDRGLVVLHVAGLEEHRLAAGRGPDAPRPSRPALERRAGKEGQQLVAMDTQHLLEEPAGRPKPIGEVGEAEACAGEAAHTIGIAEHPVTEREAGPRGLLGGVAVDEGGEVELELVVLAASVRALDLAQLALEAEVHDAVGLRPAQAPHVARVLLVDQAEEGRERVAVLEAETTPVTDLEGALHLLGERGRIPVLGFRRVVGEAVGRPIGDGGFAGHDEYGGRGARRTAAPPIAAYFTDSRNFENRPACDFSALARVSNQSAISPNPSWRAVLAIPGYMSVYSWVSPATAEARFLTVSPIGLSVAGSATFFR